MSILKEKTKNEVIEKLCELLKKISEESIASRGVFNIGVSGGSVATFLQVGLPKINADFSKWKVFFCDERVVPEDSPDSTFGFYKTNVIPNTPLEENQFVTLKQGLSAEEAAKDYAEKLKEHFGDSLPSFDVLLLGMGPDGHTCSLFPNHPLLQETSKWVAPIVDSPKPPPERITLTFPVINNAKNCIFAISGKEKGEMLYKILIEKDENLPSTRVKPKNGKLYWIMDEAAGDKITL